MKQITVLGATGSIGLSTLDVISNHPDKYSVFALTANTNVEEMHRQCIAFNPRYAVMSCADSALLLRTLVEQSKLETEVISGEEGLHLVSEHSAVDVVMAAIVGAAGLKPTLAAVHAGKRILLANKEALVMTGSLFMAAAKQAGAEILPIDSEHNAIYQCMPASYRSGMPLKHIRRILLTASGGPFRNTDLADLARVTPEQACKHPNWSMGRKISVDSATMMNKGLELIEACWLFDTTPDNIEVHVHPESIIHSMVEYDDGSVLAQMGSPDMRTPIAYGLGWPDRIESGVSSLDLFKIAQLNFEKPDEKRFPCLRLAAEAYRRGGTACAILNAANEEAVDAFLNKKIRFDQIATLIEQVMELVVPRHQEDFDMIFEDDLAARAMAVKLIEQGL
ncbi:1-deoxy-D-xylulose-5-phosphate reductoisomerase [Alkalimarinus sediminis]|uniref:1-deoxy-D-xylulose 5-phosphate reductoisomerase n=1 Tax=Alkalimarinus sediminis TaxID=1632866 RepID=A0A9E8HFA7_9ALTE|nr:1-deoxy-D-xylulose-5-phosphate reductoisomerase [Alkalimarinus sediminis]UZW73389.1 1-deoxy-D-xylulose-5-phosphate reductoisomerase [Alkalimarinus sediminis]